MTCRDEILTCALRIVKVKGVNEFSLQEVLACMRSEGAGYPESIIRTHVTSRMCRNAPKHHGTTYDDLERIGHGVYRLVRPASG